MAYDLGTAHGTIEIEYNGSREVDRAAKDMRKVGGESKDTDKSLKRLSATLKGIGKGVAVGGIAVGLANAGVAAANLAIQIAGVVPQLVSLSSLSAAIPGLLVGAGAAAGVLKASLMGVGEAAKAAFDTENPEKFNEAIKKLSPSAAAFANQIKAAVPGLTKFQQGLQESFFQAAHLDTGLQKAVGTLTGMRGPLQGLAAQMGETARQFTNFALSADSIEFVKQAIGRFRSALAEVSPSLVPVLAGLRDVGTVGLPLITQLGTAVRKVADDFGAWLSEIAADGRLQEWIDTALSTLKTLGGIAKNVGSILTSVFQAAGQTGGGLLGTIKEVTGQFATFLKSAQGQEAMTSLFTGIAAVAKQLAPVFTTLAGALAGALGPALQDLATNVGPVLLQVVQALAPAFGPLAQAIVAIASAIAPALPAVAQLVSMLVTLGAGVLTTLAANLGPIVTMLGTALSGALTALAPVLSQIVGMFPAFASAGLQLAQAMLPLVPAIIQFAAAITTALLPYLPQLMQAFLQLVPPLVQLATLFAGQLAGALQAIIPYLPAIIGGIVSLQNTILTMVSVGIRLFNFIIQLGQAFVQLPGKVAGAVASFASAVSNGFSRVIAMAQQLPFRLGAAIGSITSVLISVATRAWAALRAVFGSGISGAVALAMALPGRVRGALAALPGLVVSVARSAWNAFVGATRSGISSIIGLAHTLPGRIRSAIGSLGGLLVSAGRDVIMGLVRGMTGAIGAAVSAAANVGKSIIGGIKSTLKISSPSKVMIQIGRFVTQGLVDGMLGTAKQVKAASNKLANMITDAFRDKELGRGQRNSVLKTLSSGTKTMLGLVNRVNQIAVKLKTAQTNLTAVRKQYDDTFANAVKQTKDSFKLVTSGQNFVNLDLTRERFAAAVQQAKDFAADIAALTKRGLNKDLIQQLVDAGAAEAGPMADALANSGTSVIKEFNRLQTDLNDSANKVGKSAADALYGAGLKAAEGLVKGLASQQKQIEALMLRIAKSMEKAIKKALKIKSPSRVMFQLGQFTSEGLALGIESLQRQVQKAAQSLATASILPTVRLTAASASNAAQSVAGNTTVGGTTNVLNQTINALPGMSAKEVADYSFNKLRLGLSTGVSAAPILTPASAGA